MSKLAQFRRAEKALKEQLVLLEKLQGDSCLKREMQFEDQLKELMAEYGMDLAKVVAIFEPQPADLGDAGVEPDVKQRRAREVKVYLNPCTHKRIETKSADLVLLKAWKAEFGAELVEVWRQA